MLVGLARCWPRGWQKYNRGGTQAAQKLCCASLDGLSLLCPARSYEVPYTCMHCMQPTVGAESEMLLCCGPMQPQCLMQEGQVGREKVQVAQILKDHNVLVRGGPEQGTKLMEALVVGLLTLPLCSNMDDTSNVHLQCCKQETESSYAWCLHISLFGQSLSSNMCPDLAITLTPPVLIWSVSYVKCMHACTYMTSYKLVCCFCSAGMEKTDRLIIAGPLWYTFRAECHHGAVQLYNQLHSRPLTYRACSKT